MRLFFAFFQAVTLFALLAVEAEADLRMVIREAAWGGKQKDTSVVWQR